jgi:hypothetical protein
VTINGKLELSVIIVNAIISSITASNSATISAFSGKKIDNSIFCIAEVIHTNSIVTAIRKYAL